MTEVEKQLLDRLKTRDQAVYGLSDTMDTKAGIALVVITFLAAQSGVIIGGSRHLPGLVWIFQGTSIVCLFAAGIYAMASLWPKEHDMDTAEDLDAWISVLNRKHEADPNAESRVEAGYVNGSVLRAKERISKNLAIVQRKSDLMNWTWRFSGVALGSNLCALIALAANEYLPF